MNDSKIYNVKMYTTLSNYDVNVVASLFKYNNDLVLLFTRFGENSFRLKNKNVSILYKFLKDVIENDKEVGECNLQSIEREKYDLDLKVIYNKENDEFSLKFLYKNKIKRFNLFNSNIFILYKFLCRYLKVK